MRRRQILAVCLAVLGLCGTILVCALPMWKVTAFVGANIVTAQVFWEGLWMNCVLQSTAHMQCKAYDSILALTQDLQAARALICASIAVSVVAIGLFVVGCTIFMDRSKRSKARIATAAGVSLIVAGVLCLIPVSWSAGIVVRAFYNPLMADSQRREIGGAIYVGWGASIVLILGGGMLCTTIWSSRAGSQRMRPISVRSLQSGAPSVRSQWSQKAPLNQGRPPSLGSHQSRPSTTKSHLASRAKLMPESEQDEGADVTSYEV
uniref:Zgc:136892 n=1 Tax=Cyprinus carpio TaxID=7962 RepID=A0A8C1J6L2_CYPCA